MKTAPYAKSGATGTTSTTVLGVKCIAKTRRMSGRRETATLKKDDSRLWAGVAVRRPGLGGAESLLKTANYFPNLRGRAREGAASVGRKLPRGMNAGRRLDEEGRNAEG